jgi:hypothetical protein
VGLIEQTRFSHTLPGGGDYNCVRKGLVKLNLDSLLPYMGAELHQWAGGGGVKKNFAHLKTFSEEDIAIRFQFCGSCTR